MYKTHITVLLYLDQFNRRASQCRSVRLTLFKNAPEPLHITLLAGGKDLEISLKLRFSIREEKKGDNLKYTMLVLVSRWSCVRYACLDKHSRKIKYHNT